MSTRPEIGFESNTCSKCLGFGTQFIASDVIAAGEATSRKGRYHNVAKNVLLGNIANGLKTKKIIVGHDLPLRDRFVQELESFE